MNVVVKAVISILILAVLTVSMVVVNPGFVYTPAYGNEGNYTAGTYYSTNAGAMSDVTVETTFADKTIESISIINHNETPGIGTNAIDQIPGEIVELQSTNVDVVSGATLTSNAIIAGVESCIAQASGEAPVEEAPVFEEAAPVEESPAAEGTVYTSKQTGMNEFTVEVAMDGDKIVSVSIPENNETPGIGSNAIEQLPTAIVEAQSADVDIVSGATLTSNAIIAGVKDCLEQAGCAAPAEEETAREAEAAPVEEAPAAEGTVYTSTQTGMNEFTVEVAMDGDKIVSVSIPENNETPGIGSNAIEQLPVAIVEAQSADVDIVSGATLTSNAIIAGVKDCLEQAGCAAPAEEEVAPEAEAASVEEAPAAEGTVYTSKQTGMSEFTVEVAMDGDKIVSVSIPENNETPGIGSNAIEQLPAAIVEAQSADVDIVSGATLTSNAIIAGVKDCLEQAGCAAPAEEEAAPASEGTVYTSTQTGMNEFTVEVVMDGDKIVSVSIPENNETPGIGSNAIEQLPAAIVEAQSADVDIVSGATLTSNAIIAGVKDCLEQAKG